jgi:hypothetical protein
MGGVLGTFTTLAVNGWFSRLTANFISMMIVMFIIYLAASFTHAKLGDIGNLVLTIVGGAAFYFGDKILYPLVWQPLGLQLVPQLSVVTIGGFSYSTPVSPFIIAALPILVFMLLVMFYGMEEKGKFSPPSLLIGTLSVGVGTYALITLLSAALPLMFGIPFNISGEWAIPPLIPLTGSISILSIVYVAIAVGLWFQKGAALYAYMFLQFAGIFVSLASLNLLAMLMNIVLLGYLYLIRGSFKVLI